MGYFEQLAEIKYREGFMKGFKESFQKSIDRVVKSLLLKNQFSDKEIAQMIGIPISRVRKIKAELEKNNPT